MSIHKIRIRLEAIRALADLASDTYDWADEALDELADLEIEIAHGLPLGVIAKARAAVQEGAE